MTLIEQSLILLSSSLFYIQIYNRKLILQILFPHSIIYYITQRIQNLYSYSPLPLLCTILSVHKYKKYFIPIFTNVLSVSRGRLQFIIYDFSIRNNLVLLERSSKPTGVYIIYSIIITIFIINMTRDINITVSFNNLFIYEIYTRYHVM